MLKRLIVTGRHPVCLVLPSLLAHKALTTLSERDGQLAGRVCGTSPYLLAIAAQCTRESRSSQRGEVSWEIQSCHGLERDWTGPLA